MKAAPVSMKAGQMRNGGSVNPFFRTLNFLLKIPWAIYANFYAKFELGRFNLFRCFASSFTGKEGETRYKNRTEKNSEIINKIICIKSTKSRRIYHNVAELIRWGRYVMHEEAWYFYHNYNHRWITDILPRCQISQINRYQFRTVNIKRRLFYRRQDQAKSDLSKVFEMDDIFTLSLDTWKFVRTERDYTICCIDGMTRFSLKYWSWVIDRFLVSHQYGIIRYLDFLQGITGF